LVDEQIASAPLRDNPFMILSLRSVVSRALCALALAAGLLLAPAARAADVGGVELLDRIQVGNDGPELVLNGAGIRRIAIVKVYVAALYLPAKSSDGEAILKSNQPSRLQMRLLRDLTVEQVKSSITGALRETLTLEQKQPLEPRLQQLDSILDSMQSLKNGASFVIDYLPDTGTTVQLNGESMGNIPGADFNEALLRMWIGEHPRDRRLRNALLGLP
jgi:hypothetical protein